MRVLEDRDICAYLYLSMYDICISTNKHIKMLLHIRHVAPIRRDPCFMITTGGMRYSVRDAQQGKSDTHFHQSVVHSHPSHFKYCFIILKVFS